MGVIWDEIGDLNHNNIFPNLGGAVQRGLSFWASSQRFGKIKEMSTKQNNCKKMNTEESNGPIAVRFSWYDSNWIRWG
jgi:hypothetical protein